MTKHLYLVHGNKILSTLKSYYAAKIILFAVFVVFFLCSL